MADQSVYFGGFRVDEHLYGLDEFDCGYVDVAVFVLSWESRCISLFNSGKLKGKKCFFIKFDDDVAVYPDVEKTLTAATQRFAEVELVKFPSIYSSQDTMTKAEELAGGIAALKAHEAFIDYSSMPKVITQTLFRRFMIEGVCPRTRWGYCFGKYDDTVAVQDGFDQGVQEFFTIRGADGSGGIGTEKMGIIALGADKPLLSSYLRENNYERTHFLCATSKSSQRMMNKLEVQKAWLKNELGYSDSDFIDCDTAKIVDTLKLLNEILSETDEIGSAVDVFCLGPKSHALAACILTSRFQNVRLVARVPKKYEPFDVPASGRLSVATVSDFTNPNISTLLHADICLE